MSASDDMNLRLYHTLSNKLLSTIPAHKNWIRGAEFSPDSRLITSCSDDGFMKLWDAETNSLVAEFENVNEGVSFYSSRFHPDGTGLATGSSDGQVKVWDIRSK